MRQSDASPAPLPLTETSMIKVSSRPRTGLRVVTPQSDAFTVVEMLVAMAVLVLLVALVSQLFSSADQTSTISRKRVDADSAARTALGIIANDFARMVRRADVDVIFAKADGNDKTFFYSESPGYLPPDQAAERSTSSLVGYRIGSSFQLERLGKALTWAGSNLGFLRMSGATPAPSTTLAGAWPAAIGAFPDYNGTDDDYQTISKEVFRLEFCLMDQYGKYFLPDATWKPWADDNNNGIANIHEVRAIVVAIAVLDTNSRKLVSDMSKLAEALPDPTDADLQATPPKLMAAAWKEKLDAPDFATQAGIPVPAAGAVRVYQRMIYLNGKNGP